MTLDPLIAIEEAKSAGAEYVDVRLVKITDERILVRKGKLRFVQFDESYGFGVRVLLEGSWGFASSRRVDEEELKRISREAVKIARASSLVRRKRVKLAPVEAVEDTYSTPIKEDPFEVPLEEKISLLMECDKLMREKGEEIRVTEAFMRAHREEKVFASSEGSLIRQEIVWCGAGISATAVGNGEVQRRSLPASFRGDFATAGYEYIRGLNLIDLAPRCAEEAISLLSARSCPSGKMDVIIGGSQLYLQIHESCGHPTELDRVMGSEASYAGTSFLTTDKLGKFRYGSEIVNLVADATVKGGLGTFGYDDEGVPAQRVYLVKEGIFTGYLTDRQYAAELGLEKSTGAARASSWSRIPIVRMTNINLEPGDWDFDELIADTREGLYIETNRSWSIDDRRLNFQFGTEVGYRIVKGEMRELIRNVTYTGITYEFWRSCDAICNEKYWKMWGTPNCGKGEPPQTMFVGHGCSPARFRNVRVGVGRF
ncbi:MAG TPA: TldD/PmbA family protein [Candidatus Korarchaeota archaeon]|nr:TldD/PmbA family protein [Candidatus Korarchaeota archaeon]